MEREFWQVIPASVGLQARLDAERDRVELLADELIAERENNRRIVAGIAGEVAEWERVTAGLCATIADRDATIVRFAWAVRLDESAALLVGCLALLWSALTTPRVKEVGRGAGGYGVALSVVCMALVVLAFVVVRIGG